MLRKIAVVVGTRPEAIKMAPVILALHQSPKFEVRVLASGQHLDLVRPIFELFGISADACSAPNRGDGSLVSLQSSLLQELDKSISKHHADAVLVHGDTSTTLAAAQVSFYLKIPVGHIEAGLRTHDRFSPFPEEMNRRLTSSLSTWHFAPTTLNKLNLLQEGVPTSAIVVTGNTVVDSLRWVEEQIQNPLTDAAVASSHFTEKLPFDPLRSEFAVITAHRRENIGHGLTELLLSLVDLSQNFPDFWFVFPVHPNPVVRTPVEHALRGCRNIVLVNPLGYPEFVTLLRNCKFVVSDSGGIQEEAPSFGKHVLVLRASTERPEGIDAGTSELVQMSRSQIISIVSQKIAAPRPSEQNGVTHNPYGDGFSSQRIMRFLESADI